MTYNFDDYLNTVRQYIDNKKLHEPICAELESHLQDSADFYVEIGYDEETANKKALEDMGSPGKVALSLSRLHDVSDLYKLLIGVYIFLAVAKITDSAMSCLISGNLVIGGSLHNAYPFFGEFLNMIVYLIGGIALSLKTNRKTPAVCAAVLTVVDYFSVWVFSMISVVTVGGKLEELISVLRKWDYSPDFGLNDYFLSFLVMGIIFLILLVLFIGTFIAISIPLKSGYYFKRIFTVVSCVLICVTGVFVIGVHSHIDSRDKVQREVYVQTVSDAVDLLKEMQTIEAEDTEKVLTHFDYLTFEKSRNEDDTADCYYADIGKPTLTDPKLCLDVYDDGKVELWFSVDQRATVAPLSPLLLAAVMSEGGRWAQRSAEYAVEKYIETSAEGDSLDEMFEIIKNYNCAFSYTNTKEDGYDHYNFSFELFDFLVNYKYGNIDASDGKYFKGEFVYA